MAPSPPRLTVVLLTWNEERNIEACLASLKAQTLRDFELVVLDAASTDRTVEKVRAEQPGFPVPLRLETHDRRLSVGEARNKGVALARAPAVAFLSADAEAEPRWAEEALRSLESADLVFGRQLHTPPSWGIGPAVRALRYHHFPQGPHPNPALFASNVNAAAKTGVLRRLPFGVTPAASAVDDVLLARRALDGGHLIAYNPDMVVKHRDVDTANAEMRKNLREGLGWGAHARDLGLHRPVLLWGALLGFAGLLLALGPGVETLLLLLAVLWLPALRRAWRRHAALPPKVLLLGIAATPAFDLAFLVAYARALAEAAMQPVPRRATAKEDAP